MKRFNYLLEQTEIFSHFVQDGQLNKHTKGGGPTSPLKMKTQTKKPPPTTNTTPAPTTTTGEYELPLSMFGNSTFLFLI